MVLELHHLRLSQSDRVVWMLEEMQLPYELIIHDRDPITALSPQALKDLVGYTLMLVIDTDTLSQSPVGTAPFFRDTSVSPPVSLFESGAIVQYLNEVYGPTAKGTKLGRSPGDPDYVDYVLFFHFAASTVPPTIIRIATAAMAGSKGTPLYDRLLQKFQDMNNVLEQQLSRKKYLAGDELSLADIMVLFPYTTLRGFFPIDLSPYPNILRYIKDATSRPAYIEAMRKGDNGLEPMIEPNTRKFTQFEAFKSLTADK